jgi:hypothetical protein
MVDKTLVKALVMTLVVAKTLLIIVKTLLSVAKTLVDFTLVEDRKGSD